MKRILLTSAIFLFIFQNLKSSEDDFVSRELVGNLRTVWEVLWGPDNHLWITERFGRISRINPETGEISHLVTISSVFENGERGLMGMDLHPDFENNPYVYVVYNYGSTNQNTRIRIERYTYKDNLLTEPHILLDNIKGWWNHNGARIKIDDDLKLWFTVGDAADISLPQKLDNINGKLCRMNLDGTIPDDNPFPDSYIWSYGHRNQQGLVIANNKIYTSEHGASTDDEINLILKGRNYGWPNVEGFCTTTNEIKFCEENNVVEPILSLYPNYTLAVGGIDYYNNDLIPQWKNSLLVTALKTELILVAKLDESGEKVVSSQELFKNKFGRLRDVCSAPDGRVFVATSNRDGRASSAFQNKMDAIIEIKPKNTANLKNITNDNINIFPNPSSQNFTFTGLAEISKIEIMDSMGRIINRFDNITGDTFIWNGESFDAIKVSKGIYNAIFYSGGNISSKKIIKY